ncbi:cdc42 effector protein 1 [Dasypus novemcinctus]|uniref:cdc42 effector protein 1 n=1 Tax=Dasypus novemcinctus TaxID=9361 RepID=UPI000328A8F7|nr:cdc42 effector protein 1 [Dasypus novemcinctus]XP_004480076.1 cdc42 effector protein 1 [Dasypus novemcinctus]XP_004480077.1 cdc42 effector protein 1 [Dasypus novemcinctus]
MPGPQGAGGVPAMSLGKLPQVGWASGSQGKRRLTADMISPPLGDFRHTMHVGRGGDVFGDTSFLSNHGGSSGGTHRSPRSFLARKLQQVRRVGALPRRMASPPAPSPAPPAVSPIIKNAISLPQLNQATYDSLVVGKLSFDSSPAAPGDGRSSYGLDSGFCTISRLSRPEKPRDKDCDGSFPSEPELRRSDSLLSLRLDLDLGPSLLSELLGVMSLSEAPATETQAPAASPPVPAASPPVHGHCPNGVTTGSGPVAEARASLAGEHHHVRIDPASGRCWGAGWDVGRYHTERGARRELVEVLPQARGSWESLDREWGAAQEGSRAPVPSTVLANTLEFADAEEEEEIKV